MVRRVTEQQLGALGTLEVQVCWVLPGEADATMDLDVLSRCVEVRLAAVGLGQAGHRRQLVIHFSLRPSLRSTQRT